MASPQSSNGDRARLLVVDDQPTVRCSLRGLLSLRGYHVDEAETRFNLALGIRPNGEEALAGLACVSFTPTPTMTALRALEVDLDAAWTDENWVQVIDILE